MAAILNSVVSAIFPTYEYHYFDEQNALQTKTLNVFQKYISRNCLGYFQETHLATVVSKGYELTLSGWCPNMSHEGLAKRKVLLSLFERAPKFQYTVATDQGVTRVQYHVHKIVETRYGNVSDTHYILKEVTFQIFQRTTSWLSYDIKIARTRDNPHLCVDFDRYNSIFYTKNTDTPQEVTSGFNTPDMRLLHVFLDRILRECARENYINPIWFWDEGRRHSTCLSDVHSAREQAMCNLGWKQITTGNRDHYTRCLSEEVATAEAASTAPRTLCLDFAEDNLKFIDL